MPQTAAAQRGGNVAAAAALQFAVDVDPSRGDSQPTVLLLTQNVGGIEAAVGTVSSLLDGSPDLSPASDHLASAGAFPSIVMSMAAPSYAQIPEDVDGELGVSAVVRQQVADFLADLRIWLHRMCYVSAAARAAERTQGGTASSSSPAGAGTRQPPSGSHTTGQTAEAYMRGYTTAARPPLIDVVVFHFQEIGGKYKNKQFNAYFKEQLSAVLLPEAGWTSGLLMDERESDKAVVSSSACRRVVNIQAATSAVLNASPTSHTGHLRAPAWDYTDSHSRRSSNDVSGAETDASEEEAADPYFTAMGSIVFLSPRVMGITSCLSVPHRTYIPITDDPISYAGDAGRLFHSGKFSEAGRSRKGFLMVSLRIGTVQFNVCNLHLFNDDDNRVAFEQSPSKYTARRTRAVLEAMAECSAVVDLEEPLFLFGDYNVRMDGKAFVQWAEEKEQITIRPGKKQLRCPEHFWTFFTDPSRVAEFRRLYDGEPQRLMDEVAVQNKVELAEMPIGFAPTYSRVAYRHRGGSITAAATSPASPLPEKTTGSDASPQKPPADAETEELNKTQKPSSVSPNKSPAVQALAAVTAVAEPLTHVTAAATRDNYCHDRLPAWCDRVLFNVAGLEWIAGDRARPSPQPSPSPTTAAAVAAAAAPSGSVVRDRRRVADGPASPPSHRWYAYEAMDFVHMDHDGVYLLF